LEITNLGPKLDAVVADVPAEVRQRERLSIEVNLCLSGLFELLKDAPYNGLKECHGGGWVSLYATLLRYHKLIQPPHEVAADLVPSNFQELVHRCRLLWLAVGHVRPLIISGTKLVFGSLHLLTGTTPAYVPSKTIQQCEQPKEIMDNKGRLIVKNLTETSNFKLLNPPVGPGCYLDAAACKKLSHLSEAIINDNENSRHWQLRDRLLSLLLQIAKQPHIYSPCLKVMVKNEKVVFVEKDLEDHYKMFRYYLIDLLENDLTTGRHRDSFGQIQEELIKLALTRAQKELAITEELKKEHQNKDPEPGNVEPLAGSPDNEIPLSREARQRKVYNTRLQTQLELDQLSEGCKSKKKGPVVFNKGDPKPIARGPSGEGGVYENLAAMKSDFAKVTADYPIHKTLEAKDNIWEALVQDRHALAAFVDKPDKCFAYKMQLTTRFDAKPLLLFIVYRLITCCIYDETSLWAVHRFVKNDARGKPIHEDYFIDIYHRHPDDKDKLPFPVSLVFRLLFGLIVGYQQTNPLPFSVL
jgi:hypothetical protein